VLLRNGSTWFGFTPRNHISSDVPSDPIPQQFTAHSRERIKLRFVRLKIAAELIRILFHQINRNILDMRLSDIAQDNHP
jgi:hypothetical protein